MVQQNPYQPPRADPAGPGEAILSTGRYEFGDMENVSIDKTGRRSYIWGVISIIIGVLAILGGVAAIAFVGELSGELGFLTPGVILAVLVPTAVVNFATGFLYVSAGKAFRAVVETEGNDVELLMTGLNKMAGAFRIEFVLSIVGFVIGGVIGLMAALE